MKNKLLIHLLPFFILLAACNSSSEAEKSIRKEYKTKYFTFLIPENWKVETAESIDSHISNYFIAGEDTVFMEVSSYANNLAEHDPDILPKSVEGKVDSAAKIDNYVIFVDDEVVKRGVDIDNYRKQNISFKKISDKYRIKIITPRNSENGITGMYCDSLAMDESIGRIKMNMYGRNLKTDTEKELLKVIDDIKFN